MAERFVKSAAAREATVLEKMLSPAIVARIDKDGIQKVLSGQAIPCFTDHKDLSRSVKTTNTTDAGRSLGFAYIMYSVSEAANRNPLVIHIGEEYEQKVLANNRVNHVVKVAANKAIGLMT